MVAAHCVHLDGEDIVLMGRRDVAAAHNPVSNMKLAVAGVMPWADLGSVGVPTVLGTDGAASNNSLDMFETMKQAALLQKLGGDPTMLPAEEALEAATRRGAAALGLPGGRIAEGEAADIIQSALDKLPADYGQAVRLYDLEGCSSEQVADTLGRSVGAVHMLRARALAICGVGAGCCKGRRQRDDHTQGRLNSQRAVQRKAIRAPGWPLVRTECSDALRPCRRRLDGIHSGDRR